MRLKINQKLFLALTAYVVLGFLAWQTLSNEPITLLGNYFVISFRKLTLFILAFFTVRTVMDFLRYRAEEKHEAEESGRHQ